MNKTRGPAICLLCTKQAEPHAITGVLGNPELCSLLSIATGNTIAPDPALPNAVCRNCLLETNLNLEYQNRIHGNLMKLRFNHYIRNGNHKRAKELRMCLTKSRPIHYIDPTTHCKRTSRKLIDESLINALVDVQDQCTSTTNQPKTANNNNTITTSLANTSMVINDVRTIPGSPPPPPPSPQPTAFSYHEDDVDMRSMVTSSDDAPEPLDESNLLVISHDESENLNVTESGGVLHLRTEQQTHRQVARYQCSFCPKSYRQQHAFEKHLRKHSNEIRAQNRLQHPIANVNFQCDHPDCRQQFVSLHLLRLHRKSHKITFPCPTCTEQFQLKNDLSWHVIQCAAKQNVLEDIAAGNSDVRRPARPRTRSQGLAGRPTWMDSSRCESDATSTDSCSTDSLYSQRLARTSQWNANVNGGETSGSDVSESDLSSIATVGTADSDIVGSRSSNSSRRHHRIRREERDKRKAEKRKAKRMGVHYYKCTVCSFGCCSLPETMRHEQRYHNMLLNFYCSKCKDWYTTRENLIRHRKTHVDHNHYCDFCELEFDNQFNLEHHLLLHFEKSFDCHFCHRSFLKAVLRNQHMTKVHAGEVNVKCGILLRRGSPQKRTVPTFNVYKSKTMLQSASAGAKVLAPRRKERVWNCRRSQRLQHGSSAGIRKPGVNMCGDYFESFTDATDEFEADRQACNAPPSQFTDYTGSPLNFDDGDDQLKTDPEGTAHHDDDGGGYDVLEDMKMFSTELLTAPAVEAPPAIEVPPALETSPAIETPSAVETRPARTDADIVLVEDVVTNEIAGNTIDCSRTLIPSKKKRRTIIFELPIPIGERCIPSYEEMYVPKMITNRHRRPPVVEQSTNTIAPPSNRPFRFY